MNKKSVFDLLCAKQKIDKKGTMALSMMKNVLRFVSIQSVGGM